MTDDEILICAVIPRYWGSAGREIIPGVFAYPFASVGEECGVGMAKDTARRYGGTVQRIPKKIYEQFPRGAA